ncbi:bacterioferritin [Halobacteriovorax marinus]|uniref:Bacterioferritin n=1 Tax=Halobacteriovorax marinus TaxID=97084 RepID=A0A1Y5FAX9_9BACT|nr:bacterioferritin [Halobacteriovorax marinus]
MKANSKIISALNDVLVRELTAINQYFLHARMLENWGLDNIGGLEYKASIRAMKDADELIKRILFLEGLPNLQKLNRIKIGQNVEEILKVDLEEENETTKEIRVHIEFCEKEQDYVTRDLFSSLLSNSEEHVDWLETQQDLVKSTGVKNYIQSQIDLDKSGH